MSTASLEQPDAPTPTHPQQLRLDSWLHGAALSRHAAQPTGQAIRNLHQQGLAVATQLLQLKSQGRATQALSHLHDLRYLRQRLLTQLTELEQATRPAELN